MVNLGCHFGQVLPRELVNHTSRCVHRVFLEKIDMWVDKLIGKTHPQCGQHHPMTGSPDALKKLKKREACSPAPVLCS